MSYHDGTSIGWRGRIAIIKPRAGYADIAGFYRMAPTGVVITASVLSNPLTQASIKQLADLGDYILETARLLAMAEPDILIWNCTTGSLVKGYGYDQELIKRIVDATKIPATTTTTAVLTAFKKLGIRKISLATPYIDEVNEIEKKFFEDNGIQVCKFKGLGILDAGKMKNLASNNMYQLATQVDLPEADCVFISCTALDVLDIIEPLEHDLKKPIITSNQAAFWHALHMLRIGDSIIGFGILLSEPR